MALIIKNGNLLEATEDIIAHQVNCQGVMGSGVALQIKKKYPRAFVQYSIKCDEYENKKELLGNCQLVIVSEDKIVANLFGQHEFGKINKLFTVYTSLRQAFQLLHDCVTNPDNYYYGKTIAIPYNIGCGLGNGDWNVVEEMLKEIFHDIDIVAYKLEE